LHETHEIRLKRLKMRSMRRGIKEMDMILGTFAQSGLPKLGVGELETYEEMLGENDHDLYGWFSGRLQTPAQYASLIEYIATALEKENSFGGSANISAQI